MALVTHKNVDLRGTVFSQQWSSKINAHNFKRTGLNLLRLAAGIRGVAAEAGFYL